MFAVVVVVVPLFCCCSHFVCWFVFVFGPGCVVYSFVSFAITMV